MRLRFFASLLVPVLCFLSVSLAGRVQVSQAQVPSEQPYINFLKKEMKSEAKPQPQREMNKSNADPYLKSIKKNLPPDRWTRPGQSYTEQLKAVDPNLKKPEDEGRYIEEEKAKLPPLLGEEQGGAIQALKEGRSELKAVTSGKINHALGFRYGDGNILNREIKLATGTQARDFKDAYGANYSPELSFFYEYQPFHSEWFGNFGLIGILGVGYFNGLGAFKNPVTNPGGVGNASTPEVKFQFFMIPATVGINYRFNLFRIVRPYVLVGPSIITYYEKRNDGMDGHLGSSRGVTFSLGASLLLDWISSSNTWEMYSNYGFKHYYLTLDYSRFETIRGKVDFTLSGFTVGLTFEY